MNGRVIQNRGGILASSMAAFTAYALSFSILGPSLPAIVRDFALVPVEIGALAAATSIGFLCVLPAGILADLVGKRKILVLGIAVLAIGMTLASLSPSFSLLLGALVLAGAGGGLFEAPMDAFMSEVYKDRRGFAMNALLSMWGFGGFLGPLLAGLIHSKVGLWQPTFLLAGSIVGATIIPIIATPPRPAVPNEIERRDRPTLKPNVSSTLALATFIEWGVEISIASFLPLFLQSERGFENIAASASLSMLFITLAFGRAVWSVTSDRLGLHSSIKISTASAAALILLAAAIPVQLAAMTLFMFTGFFLASVSPSILALVAREAGLRTGSATGFILLIASIGGIIVPWSIALISAATTLFTGFACLSILMVSIALLTHRAQRRQGSMPGGVPA